MKVLKMWISNEDWWIDSIGEYVMNLWIIFNLVENMEKGCKR